MPLGEDGYEADAEKRRSTGQILWIRGLTRLQTQVETHLKGISEFRHFLLVA